MKFNNEEKAKYLSEWKRSGIKAWTFAKEKGICPQTFTKWVKKEKKRKNCFVEITAKAMPNLESTREIVIEKGGIKIHIPLSVWAEGARVILEGLKAEL